MNLPVSCILFLLVIFQGVRGVVPVIEGVVVSGYDVVAYFDLYDDPNHHLGTLGVQGLQEFSYSFTYGQFNLSAEFWFSTAENRDRFIEDPWRFAPKYGGYCSWGIAREMEPAWPWNWNWLGPAAGPHDSWRVYNGSLYMNLQPSVRELFFTQETFLKNIAAADERWTKWWGSLEDGPFNWACIDGGACHKGPQAIDEEFVDYYIATQDTDYIQCACLGRFSAGDLVQLKANRGPAKAGDIGSVVCGKPAGAGSGGAVLVSFIGNDMGRSTSEDCSCGSHEYFGDGGIFAFCDDIEAVQDCMGCSQLPCDKVDSNPSAYGHNTVCGIADEAKMKSCAAVDTMATVDNICYEAGMRTCTADEIERGELVDTVCDLHDKRVWSADICDIPDGLGKWVLAADPSQADEMPRECIVLSTPGIYPACCADTDVSQCCADSDDRVTTGISGLTTAEDLLKWSKTKFRLLSSPLSEYQTCTFVLLPEVMTMTWSIDTSEQTITIGVGFDTVAADVAVESWFGIGFSADGSMWSRYSPEVTGTDAVLRLYEGEFSDNVYEYNILEYGEVDIQRETGDAHDLGDSNAFTTNGFAGFRFTRPLITDSDQPISLHEPTFVVWAYGSSSELHYHAWRDVAIIPFGDCISDDFTGVAGGNGAGGSGANGRGGHDSEDNLGAQPLDFCDDIQETFDDLQSEVIRLEEKIDTKIDQVQAGIDQILELLADPSSSRTPSPRRSAGSGSGNERTSETLLKDVSSIDVVEQPRTLKNRCNRHNALLNTLLVTCLFIFIKYF